MGTRGFTGFVLNGQVRYSYQQYDAYPTGTGRSTCQFARDTFTAFSVQELRARVENMRLVGEEEKVEIDGATKEGYWAYRDQQGDLGAMFASGVMVSASPGWADDSLFCEWGYLVNLDDLTVEFYQGFQSWDSKHRGGRFDHERPEGHDTEYAPVRLLATESLFALSVLTDAVIERAMNFLEQIESDAPVPTVALMEAVRRASAA